MGITGWLGLIYLILAVCTVLSFAFGKTKAGLSLLALMLTGLLILGYLWFTSPM